MMDASAKPKKLLDQVSDRLRLKHYSYRTEQSYRKWIARYIIFHDKRHPKEMGQSEIQEFLTYLAVDRKLAASTQNQALSALLFLYREVLEMEVGLNTACSTPLAPNACPLCSAGTRLTGSSA